VIAYSTCSQLGYMFIAAGVGAYQASIFHLLTHAFFKALLFMGAGAVIHAMSDQQDIRKMGGIWKKIPATYALMWIGSLALAGVYPFAGYFSKDAIIEAAWASHSWAGRYGFWCAIIAAFLTAFYSWRLLILTFHGKPRADQHTMDHVHESPLVMILPLVVLAAGALLTGLVFHEQLLGQAYEAFWGDSIHVRPGNDILDKMHHVPGWVTLAPSVVGFAGIALAYLLYIGMPHVPGQLATRFGFLYRFLLNKWYFDELYDLIIVHPLRAIARFLWQVGDAKIIDGLPNGIAALTRGSMLQVVKLQTGSIANYAFAMLIGLVLLISIFLFVR
jgi:NADH-quinone oxidoreductase subunit L